MLNITFTPVRIANLNVHTVPWEVHIHDIVQRIRGLSGMPYIVYSHHTAFPVT